MSEGEWLLPRLTSVDVKSSAVWVGGNTVQRLQQWTPRQTAPNHTDRYIPQASFRHAAAEQVVAWPRKQDAVDVAKFWFLLTFFSSISPRWLTFTAWKSWTITNAWQLPSPSSRVCWHKKGDFGDSSSNSCLSESTSTVAHDVSH